MAHRPRPYRAALGRGRAARPARRHPLTARARALGVYVHVPFCAARCPYCDFATAPATSRLRARYLAALRAEIRREGALLGRPRARTLYVGGGTPSLLEPDEVDALADALRSAFDLRPLEATVEANPATLDRARLGAWKRAGITRLSLGAQSLSARGLRALGRTHQPGDVAPAVAAARSTGLAVGIDLIFGWPGQTALDWRNDLAGALALSPDHLSCYPLELEREREEADLNWPGGGWPVVARWRERAAAAAPGDDAVASLYEEAERVLRRAGFRHYEIANWARPRRRSLHNLAYWRNEQWVGLGAGAHSHLGGVRSRNPAALAAYAERVERGEGRIEIEHAASDARAGRSDEAVDSAILALRLDEGLALDHHAARFGPVAAARARRALQTLDGTGLVRWSGDTARLTARGRLLASEVFLRLLP